MFKVPIEYLLKVATVIGLGGAADKVDVEQAKVQAQQKIDQVCIYHNIPVAQKQQMMQNLNQNLDKQGFLGEIEVLDLLEKIENKEESAVFGVSSINNKMPKGLNLSNVYYFRSCSQPNGWACGFFSAYNALALNQIFSNPIQFQNLSYAGIFNIVAQKWNHDKSTENSILVRNWQRFLLKHRLYKLAQQNNLNNNFYILGISGNQGICYQPYVDEDLAFSDDPQDQFNYNNQIINAAGINHNQFWTNLKTQLDNAIHNNTRLNLYFVCNVASASNASESNPNEINHWVLLSIIKQVNKKPVIILLDSLNRVVANKNYCAYIRYLHNKFIAPYVNQNQQQANNS